MTGPDFLSLLRGVRKAGAGFEAHCPVHEDRKQSMSVTITEDRILAHCHVGCGIEAICEAVRITPADLFLNPGSRNGASAEEWTPRGPAVAIYDYVDETGKLLFQVCRTADKQFPQRRPDPASKSGWRWKLGSIRRVPYRLPRVIDAVAAGVSVWVCEGEKDVHSLERAGVVATTNPGGADKSGRSKWQVEWNDYFRGAIVAVVADRDEAGRAHARHVARQLATVAKSVELCEPAEGKDVTDHLAAGLGLDELVLLLGEEEGAPFTPPNPRATAQPPPIAPPELASEQRILDRFKEAVRGCGVVGEEATAATLYLLITSRLLDRPVSAAVKGHSSSGKSFTTETTARFFPPEAVIEMTAMSERALVYSPEDYQHRTLIIYEAVALREGNDDNLTSYFVRSLLSEGRIEYPVTVRDKDGSYTVRTIVKTGPTNLIVTTTKTKIHAENETRLLSLTTDDSREQTERVLLALADEDRGGAELLGQWHHLQGWLQQAEHRVTIPYARRLAELVPPVAVRLRRDFGAVLALVRTHAILHQQNRERDEQGRIVATIDDYAQVRGLVADLIAEGVGVTVAPTVRETVDAVKALAGDGGVTARAVAQHLGLDKSNVSRRLRMAADGGYVRNLEEKRGRPGRWVAGDPMPEETELLPQPRNLSDDESAGQASGCAVAREVQGIEGDGQ